MAFNAKRVGGATVADRFAHRDVLVAISSGSLFYLDNLRRIGWRASDLRAVRDLSGRLCRARSGRRRFNEVKRSLELGLRHVRDPLSAVNRFVDRDRQYSEQ